MADSKKGKKLFPEEVLQGRKIADFILEDDFMVGLAGMELVLHMTSKAAEQEMGTSVRANPFLVGNLCKMELSRKNADTISDFSPKECVEACLRWSDYLLTEFKSLDDAVDSKYAEEVKTLGTKRNKLPQLGENGRFEDKGFNPSKEDISLAHELLSSVISRLKEMSRADHESNSAHGEKIEALDKVIAESSNVLEPQEIVGADFRLGNNVSGMQNVEGSGNRPSREGSAASERGASGGAGGPAGDYVGIG